MAAGDIYPIFFLDEPLLDTSVTPIPGSGSPPLEVIAVSNKKAAFAIDYIDTTGDWIGVYTGPIGQEVLRSIIGGGVTWRAYVVIGSESRVSFRSMTTSAITNGKITCTFLGMGWP